MQQQLRPLDVSQKAIAQTRASMRPFNPPRNVGDDERAKVSEIDDAEMRFERRERIVRDLRTSRRHRRDESRLAGVGKTNQTDVCEQLQLQLQIKLFALASALMVARCTIRRGREVRVAKTTAATARSQPTVVGVTEVVKQIARCSVKDLCAHWHAHNQVGAGMARTIRALAMRTTLGHVLRVITQVQQCVQRRIGDENDVASATAIAARWTTAR